MSIEREVRVTGLPKFEGVQGKEKRRAEDIAKKWLKDSFKNDGAERVLMVHPKGFAFLLMEDAAKAQALETSDDEVIDIDWEGGQVITVKVRGRWHNHAGARAGHSNTHSTRRSTVSSGSTAAPSAAPTGEDNVSAHPPADHGASHGPAETHDEPEKKMSDKTDKEVKKDAKKKIDAAKPETVKAKEFKLGDRSTWTHEGFLAWAAKEGVEITLEALILKFGGNMAMALWNFFRGNGDLKKQLSGALTDHLFGKSPRDEFAKCITSKLTLPERQELALLLRDREFFNPGQINEFYTLTVSMFEKPDPANPGKCIPDEEGKAQALKIIKQALTLPTHDLQVDALSPLYVSRAEMPIGKLGHMLEHVNNARLALDAEIASSALPQVATDFRDGAARARRSRGRKW